MVDKGKNPGHFVGKLCVQDVECGTAGFEAGETKNAVALKGLMQQAGRDGQQPCVIVICPCSLLRVVGDLFGLAVSGRLAECLPPEVEPGYVDGPVHPCAEPYLG